MMRGAESCCLFLSDTASFDRMVNSVAGFFFLQGFTVAHHERETPNRYQSEQAIDSILF